MPDERPIDRGAQLGGASDRQRSPDSARSGSRSGGRAPVVERLQLDAHRGKEKNPAGARDTFNACDRVRRRS
jgi:hypothetical protein